MKRMKKTIAGVLSILVALSAVGFVGCSENDVKNVFEEVKGTVNELIQGDNESEVENKPSVSEYAGTIVKDGESYEMLSAMAFTATEISTTETETFTPVSVDLKATVEPIDANQNVVWSWDFVDTTSEWANGKDINDYMQVTQSSSSVSTGTVICYKPFGEQIKITATSAENADISASCIVDFVQSVKSVALSYGDTLPINLGGVTDVAWEVNPNGIGLGGVENFVVEYYQTYTIANELTAVVDLVSPSYYHNGNALSSWGDTFDPSNKSENEYEDNYFKLYSAKWVDVSLFDDGIRDCGVKSFKNITELQFNHEFLQNTCLSALVSKSMSSTEIDYIYQTYGIYGTYTVNEGSLYTLRLRMTHSATGEVVEKVSLLNVTNFTNNPIVKSIVLDNVSLKF